MKSIRLQKLVLWYRQAMLGLRNWRGKGKDQIQHKGKKLYLLFGFSYRIQIRRGSPMQCHELNIALEIFSLNGTKRILFNQLLKLEIIRD